MARDNINDIQVFLAVARERSFTRAAATLGMSQSALSHIVRALEARMGVQLLARTTRSVAPTAAGERLIDTVAPRFAEIEAEIAAISDMGGTPAGTIRITAIDHIIDSVLWPRLAHLLPQYPHLRIEINSDYRMHDIVAERYDIGVRYGNQVEQDMIAVRLTPDVQMAIVASPDYWRGRRPPATIAELQQHNCITLRLAGNGGVYAWELCEGGQMVDVRVSGQATFNSACQMLNAALYGVGLAFLSREMVAPWLKDGRLVSVMNEYCPAFPALHAYYLSRRHSSRAFSLVIEALRYQG
ncbi:LysR family transcriptional regulator [Janthinobacterium sp. RB2R34]|uniref:LysR family transcriptional regulator n=1 Tax=Janthinobacterium sp. RB2R34 TaxID=3424193 RepID=UPI003F1EBC19